MNCIRDLNFLCILSSFTHSKIIYKKYFQNNFRNCYVNVCSIKKLADTKYEGLGGRFSRKFVSIT